MRPCIEPACPNLTQRTRCAQHETERQRERNADPERVKRYGGSWRSESRRVIAASPLCATCGTTSDLTVDHMPGGGRQVLCRPCHGKLEAARRKARASR